MRLSTHLEAEVQALAGLDLQGLRLAWRSRFGPPPKLRSPELLRLALAFRIQAEIHGGLDASTRRRLRARSVTRTHEAPSGLRITKVWRGEAFEVDRVEDGYRWADRVFPSLTAVAFAMTGVKRNGPKFFGLREEARA